MSRESAGGARRDARGRARGGAGARAAERVRAVRVRRRRAADRRRRRAGVLAFSVSARTREFGVRLAIGSTPRHLLLRRPVARARSSRRSGSSPARRAAMRSPAWPRAHLENVAAAGRPADPGRRSRARRRGRPRVADARRARVARGRAAGAPIGIDDVLNTSTLLPSEAIASEPTSTSRKPLRLWPGVVVADRAVAAVSWASPLSRRTPRLWACSAAVARRVLILLWWLFFSRAPWLERLGRHRPDGRRGRRDQARSSHESIARRRHGDFHATSMPIRVLSLALVAWAVVSRGISRRRPARVDGRRDPARVRRCTLIRTGGSHRRRIRTALALDADGRRTAAGSEPRRAALAPAPVERRRRRHRLHRLKRQTRTGPDRSRRTGTGHAAPAAAEADTGASGRS